MSSETTILVVDDDEKIRNLLRRCLEADGHQVVEATNKTEVEHHLRDRDIDLITLDLQLGQDNGLSIAASVRERYDTPIVMVTGKGDVIDKVVGLELGADDYISKPFHIREVQARIRAVLRRTETAQKTSQTAQQETKVGSGTTCYCFMGWQAFPDKMELVSSDGKPCELTSTDFRLLMIFLQAPNRILSRDQIMDQLSGQSWTPYDRTIDNQVARLRKKIEPDVNNPRIIKTVRGVGYLFAADVEHG